MPDLVDQLARFLRCLDLGQRVVRHQPLFPGLLDFLAGLPERGQIRVNSLDIHVPFTSACGVRRSDVPVSIRGYDVRGRKGRGLENERTSVNLHVRANGLPWPDQYGSFYSSAVGR